jgi:hypothetical protein
MMDSLVKFIIEIYSTGADDSEKLLQRKTIAAINPAAARKQAKLSLAFSRKAIGARVLNLQNELISEIRK